PRRAPRRIGTHQLAPLGVIGGECAPPGGGGVFQVVGADHNRRGTGFRALKAAAPPRGPASVGPKTEWGRRGDTERNVAGELDGARSVLAGGDVHGATAHLCCGLDGGAERGGRRRGSVAFGAVVEHVEGRVFSGCKREYEENKRKKEPCHTV